MIAPAIRDLVGLPYDRPFDCGSLAVEVLRICGIDVGPLTETEPEEILAALERARFARVASGLADGDVLVFALPRRFTAATEAHVGVLVDCPRFIHALVGRGVVLHSLDQLAWRRCLVGAYRRT